MATGGSIASVTLDGRSFGVAADADSGRKLGGSENELQQNGNGTARLIKTLVSWELTDLTISIDDDAGDAEYIQGLADRNTLFPILISYVSGAIYQGSGQVTGENPTSSQSTTAAINLMGSGKLTKQA